MSDRQSDSSNLTFFEKAASAIAPRWTLSRMMAKGQLTEFAAVRKNGARSRPASVYDQGSSESWKKQRERIDAMMDARSMEENFCIIAGALHRLAMYICGQLEYQPETGDSEADKEYSAYFHDWCARADYSGRHRLRKIVELAIVSAIRDGEFGLIEHVEQGELRLQMIEADRIGGVQNSKNEEDNINGIKIDSRGRVTAYEIYKRTRTSSYEKEGEVKPDKFIHLFFPNRSDQYHGVSKLAPALPHAKDLYELFGHEKIAAKFAASFAAFVRSKDPGSPGAEQWSENPQGKGHPSIMQARAGTVMKLDTNVEDFQFAPGVTRPNGAFMALVEALIREMALALDLNYGFFYNMAAFGGVTARLETQSVQRTIRWYQEQLQTTILDRVKRKVLLFGIASKKIRYTKNWNVGSWRFGATLTGDVGHQTQADLALVTAGIKTRAQLAGEFNNDIRQNMESEASVIKEAMEISKRNGVPIELLLRDLPNPSQVIAAFKKAEAGVVEDEAPPGLIGEVGEKGVKALLDLVMAVNKGEMDRASAINTAVTVYGLPVEEASQLFPQPPTL